MEGKNLVIVESPGKVKTIQKFLGADYLVKASIGHIRDLQEKKLSVDVEHGFQPEYVVPADKKKVVSDLKKLAAAAQTVWLASDEDREGEAISWHLSETLGLDPAKTRRIVFHEITKPAILDAIEHPRDIDRNLVDAQQARRVLDRLVGFELSPVLWRMIQPKLSAGRVQDTRFDSKEEARKFLEDSVGATYQIDTLEKKEGTRFPAAPFTTSTLQQEASRKLHFPVGTTMRVAQTLYERGLITYMRTDSTNLSTLALGTAKKFIVDNFGAEYSHTRQYRTKAKGAQEAHEAIRPTYIENTAIEGTAQEKKLYELIWKRTVASQMSESRVMNTSIRIASDRRSEHYAVQAAEMLFDGFMKVYLEGRDDEEPEEGELVLPELHVGDRMQEKGVSAQCKYTVPPQRYSEATLVKKLEELEIGRPSTYATIISTLTTGRGYVTKGDKDGVKMPVTDLHLKDGSITEKARTETVGAERGKLLPQEIGIIVSDYLVKNFGAIMDYDFTANVEKDFDEIADGGKVWNETIGDFYKPFHQQVESVLAAREYSRVNRELGTAPDGDKVIAAFGKFGAYVQKGEGERRQFASLGKGQLIETITLEEALKLFELPRNVGEYEGIPVIATKGRFGPYLKYGERNIKLPRNADPLKIKLEECIRLIQETPETPAANAVIAEWGPIQIVNGRYGPYLKSGENNYRIPKGTDVSTLTEADCQAIIAASDPTSKGRRRFKK